MEHLNAQRGTVVRRRFTANRVSFISASDRAVRFDREVPSNGKDWETFGQVECGVGRPTHNLWLHRLRVTGGAVKWSVALLLVAGLGTSACGGVLYDQAQAAYGREDNATAFMKCVEVIESRPVSPDAPHARYLMELLMAGKLRPQERRQVLEQLQPTRPWLAAFLGGLDAEAKTNWNQAAGLTLEFIAGAPDDGWRKLATAQLCQELPEAQNCTNDLAMLTQAAIRLRQMTLRDCSDALRQFAERLIAQHPDPNAARFRVEWRRVLLAAENSRNYYFSDYFIKQMLVDCLAIGEAKGFAAELLKQRPKDLSVYLLVAKTFANTSYTKFVSELLQQGIQNLTASERGELLKYLPEQQEILYQKFSETKDNNAARTLAAVWREGFLMDELCSKITQEHYHLVLRQVPAEHPAWDVCIYQTFPFPDVLIESATKLYCNDEVNGSLWAGARAMSATNTPVASMAGGEFKNGDVLQAKVDLKQKRQWQISLWTNKITLEGLQP